MVDLEVEGFKLVGIGERRDNGDAYSAGTPQKWCISLKIVITLNNHFLKF